MKTIIIYDSNFGNTKILAEAIAQECGQNAWAVSVNEVTQEDLSGIDLIILGSPINAWRPTKKMQDFVGALKLNNSIKAAAFDTRVKSFISGNAAKRLCAGLKNSGATIISEPIGFYVAGQKGPLLAGERNKAKVWAAGLFREAEKSLVIS